MRLLSPAKLNLSLKVRKKLVNGYHEVVYQMHTIDLVDHLDFVLGSEDSFQSNFSCSDNLILRALDLFRKKTGSNDRVAITLRKNIPIEAGLGGGSGNAATTLFALSKLTKQNVPVETLAKWAAELGVDVPFFFGSGSSLCAGIGDECSELAPIEEDVWIAKPPFGLSTEEVYSYAEPNDLALTLYENDLEKAAFRINPEIGRLRRNLEKLGFTTVCMTGSGSSFFCIGDVQNPNLPGITFYKSKFIHRKQSEWYVK